MNNDETDAAYKLKSKSFLNVADLAQFSEYF
jgi:hypothetical protein